GDRRAAGVADRQNPGAASPGMSQRALFVRLSRCNLHCPPCDTPYTWDWTRFDPRAESRRMAVDEVVDWVSQRDPDLVVVTGGEPLLQQPRLLALAERLVSIGRRVEIETNGTIAPEPALVAAVARFVVSPKLPSFAHPADPAINAEALRAFVASGRAAFKFVAATASDLDAVADLVDTHHLEPVWIMPASSTSQQLIIGLRELAEATLARGWHLSGRLHLLLWEDARGR
ncbi:MAG: 7-carboxy-7-deazaguanine synthase QueE, partial [Micromonosporaceae bacterium]|nr:7-carboxy-7-deazaguanine synthase QueE [Micromonosporaceae bacterium]